MSGRGKVGKNIKESRSKRTGLKFPVGRINSMLRKNKSINPISYRGTIYLAAVLEYLIADLTIKAALDNKESQITARHLKLAIRDDEELNTLLSSVAQGGVLPNIQPQLLPKNTDKK